jgi:ribose/xylose/arabinose/galactoside ABC-type transport system permease subunit
MNVSAYWQTVVIGVVIVAAVWVDVVRKRSGADDRFVSSA